MRIRKEILLLITAVFFCGIAKSQVSDRIIVEKKDTLVTIPYCAASVGWTFPFGEMGKRYESFMDLGVDVGLKTKGNWIFSLNFGFQFATDNVKIKNEILRDMMTLGDNPFVISEGGTNAGVIASNRNLSGRFSFGKVVPLWFSNSNSGLMVTVGAGWLQHQIVYQATSEIAAQLEGDYQYLYDRQMRGPIVSGFIGYLFFGKYSFANFYVGVQFDQAWTTMSRQYQADLRSGDTKTYIDRMITLKAAWVFQFHNPTSQRVHF
ncbi:MAG: hypothetical protein LBO06_00455 [Bacteroidales bacterium]|jgi:hypothetical protein|nr:hypothetical protein [Bacteroidales bacterium]